MSTIAVAMIAYGQLRVLPSRMEMIEIEVDDEVFGELQRLAEPLVDDANSVLRRILFGPADAESASDARRKGVAHHGKVSVSVSPKLTARGTAHRRASSDELFAKQGFTLPILEALVELGGSGSPKAIMGRVFAKVGEQLGPVDLERPAHGGIRWLSRAHYHRYELIEKGLIENPRRGTWVITDEGRAHFQRHQSDGNSQST